MPRNFRTFTFLLLSIIYDRDDIYSKTARQQKYIYYNNI